MKYEELLSGRYPNISFCEENEDSLNAFLSYLYDNDKWITLDINDVKIDAEAGSLYLNVDGKETFLNDAALYTVKRRAKDNAEILDFLSPSQVADMLNMSWPVLSGEVNCLERGGQIIAMHSDRYAILPQKKVFEMFKNYLELHAAEVTFNGATYTHDYTRVEYGIYDFDLYETLVQILVDCKFDVTRDDIKISVVAATSDTGASCVTLIPYVSICGKKFPFAKPLKVLHKGDADDRESAYAENLGKLLSLLSEGLENLKRLYNLPIKHSYPCALHIGKKVGIPAKFIENFRGLLEGFEMSAGDVYSTLCEITDLPQFEAKEQKRQIQLMDSLSKVLYLSVSEWNSADYI